MTERATSHAWPRHGAPRSSLQWCTVATTRLPRGGGNGGEMSPFPLPPSESSTPELAGRAYVHASGAAAVSCCPLIAIGSTTDRVWPWGLPARWSDVAAAGFRCEEVEAVAHFKLMADAKVVDKVQRELAAAALVQARWA